MATPRYLDGDQNHHLVQSSDPRHPANLLPALCDVFWHLGWVPGTGGGASLRDGDLIYLAPSGVEKERMKASDLYVLALSAQKSPSPRDRIFLRAPPPEPPSHPPVPSASQCTPLFLACFIKRNAGCCIHTHSQWAVLVTLLLERERELELVLELDDSEGSEGSPSKSKSKSKSMAHVFQINNLEQIKGFGRGMGKKGQLDFHDTLRVPVIENTPREEDLLPEMERVLDEWPDTYAILVRRHGLYIWGDDVVKAKTMAESMDYIFQLAVEMKKLGIPWISKIG